MSSSLLSTSLILGCSSLAGLYHPVSEEEAIATVRTARDLGIVMFDTAPHYGCGLSEQRLGKALLQHQEKNSSHPIQLYTKVGRIMVNVDPMELKRVYEDSNGDTQYYQERQIDVNNVPGSPSCIFPEAPNTVLPVYDYSKNGALKSYEDSIQRLMIGHSNKDVSLRLRIHDCETDEHITQVLHPRDGALQGLLELRDQKKIDDISIGVNELAAAMRIVHEAPHGSLNSVLIAGQWNLLDHSTECIALFTACEERNIRIHNAGIFASGVICGGSTHRYQPVTPDITKKIQQWNDLCQQYDNIDLPAVAMKFALLPTVVEAIAVGAKNPMEVTEIVTWFQCSFDHWLDLFGDAHQRHLLTDDVYAYIAKLIGDS